MPRRDPNQASDIRLTSETPRWQRRHLGVLVVLVVMLTLAWAAWHYTHEVPPSDSHTVPVPLLK